MIQSFRGKASNALWLGKRSKLPEHILVRAAAKLAILDAATALDQLMIPPSNHLEALSGDRAGRYSIRVNNQWRICFRWKDGHAHEVEIVDYH